jgi:two-component sensor histidine kinase
VVGLTVLGLSVVGSWYFFLTPRGSVQIEASGVVALATFALFGGAIVAIVHQLNLTVEALLAERRRSHELLDQRTRAEAKLAQLNGELLHRIRNIFTLATAMASQTSRSATTPKEMADALTGRFQALAVAQELLLANELADADIKDLAADLLEPLAPKRERLSLAGPSRRLTPEAATALCLVLHELGTNAVKHGAWSNTNGNVDVKWVVNSNGEGGPSITLLWGESGGPPCAAPERAGLGTMLIENAVAGAIVERQFSPNGFRCSIRFALAQA